jgi:hypothetical protein
MHAMTHADTEFLTISNLSIPRPGQLSAADLKAITGGQKLTYIPAVSATSQMAGSIVTAKLSLWG